MDLLSQQEVARLRDTSESGLHESFRRCSLAVLNCGSGIDDSRRMLELFHDFDIRVAQQGRGVQLEISNAPAEAFVDGRMITGIKEHLFAVLRDIVFVSTEFKGVLGRELVNSAGITDAVFHILRNADLVQTRNGRKLAVCWGGHSIAREEYDYSKEVGYQMGLRGLDICTGCGPGAMKGPMKGATIGHAKQRIYDGSYIGITEPGIIAAEPPNPLVNALVIMPDIEKRLEAFVRLGHAIVVFPGGVGTAEELLYLLGILLHPANAHEPFPLVFTGPTGSEGYFRLIADFVGATLGAPAERLFRIVIGDPALVAQEVSEGAKKVWRHRYEARDACYFNWRLVIDPLFQRCFEPTHENMAALDLSRDQPVHLLAANLRRAFSGIVAGNVKQDGIAAVERDGPFEIRGDASITAPLGMLLETLAAQGRMKLPGSRYTPCYRVVA